jgi:hypothetical protein
MEAGAIRWRIAECYVSSVVFKFFGCSSWRNCHGLAYSVSLVPSFESTSSGSRNDEGLSESLKDWPSGMTPLGVPSLGAKLSLLLLYGIRASRQPLDSLMMYPRVCMSSPISYLILTLEKNWLWYSHISPCARTILT